MKFLIVLVILPGLLFASGALGQSSGKIRTRPCNTPTLKNGNVRIKQRGKFARFLCNSEFTLHGQAMSWCTNGRWDGEMPICIAPGCAEMASPPNATLTYLGRGTGVKLTCNSRFELVGNDAAFCDGITWDRKIGTCRETNITSSLLCDFEGRLKCGWFNYLLNEKDWVNTNMGRYGIGPQHDHTKMTKYEGFFMLLEGDSPRYATPSYLFSPMYDSDVSNNSCFKFYYHMYGVTTGSIRVFVKTAKQSDSNFFSLLRKSALLEISNRSSNVWVEALVRLPTLDDKFQIVIQGELMRGQRTDLAIDDVEILNGAACEADKVVVTKKPESEAGGIFEVQSCEQRCNETTPVPRKGKTNILICDCYDGCEEEETCCPDYAKICVYGDTIPAETTTSNITAIRTTMPTTSSTTTTVQPTSTKKQAITTRENKYPKYKHRTTEANDILEFATTTVHYMNDDYKSFPIDRFPEDIVEVKVVKTGVPQWAIVTGVLFSVMVIGTVVGLYVYRERTRASTPAEMKKRYHCKSANEEFSEIRFLTDDEQLDLKLATPMDDYTEKSSEYIL